MERAIELIIARWNVSWLGALSKTAAGVVRMLSCPPVLWLFQSWKDKATRDFLILEIYRRKK